MTTYRLKVRPGNPFLALFAGDPDGNITGGVVADSEEAAKEAHLALLGNENDEVLEVTIATKAEVDEVLSYSPDQEILIAGGDDPLEGKYEPLRNHRPEA